MSAYATVIDNRNFEYPTCGGRAIRTNGTHYILEIDSNYQGRLTGYRLRVPVEAVKQADSLLEMDLEELENLRIRCGGKVLRRGYPVQ